MDKPFPEPGSDESQSEFNEFIRHYGFALAIWASVEDQLCYLFGQLAGIERHKIARGLFFSGRSFATRADLYASAIATSELPEFAKAVHRAILKKARHYSSARNSIAHGIPTRLIGEWPYEGVRLKEGDKMWREGGVSQAELEEAMSNFMALKNVIVSTIATWPINSDEKAALEHLELVRALPKHAFPRAEDRSLEASE